MYSTMSAMVLVYKCDALRDMVPFAQFNKCEKHEWRRVAFSKLKVTLFHGCLSPS